MRPIARRSTIFEIGDIVRVPFPYMDQTREQARPSLVVSRPVGIGARVFWTLMITSAKRSSWPGDIAIGDNHLAMGLPVPCRIRTAKIAAFEVGAVERVLGRLPPELLAQVRDQLRANLGWH